MLQDAELVQILLDNGAHNYLATTQETTVKKGKENITIPKGSNAIDVSIILGFEEVTKVLGPTAVSEVTG